VTGFEHHGLVNGTSHSGVAKRERLRDKSPPSATLRRITTKGLPMRAFFVDRPALPRLQARGAVFALLAALLFLIVPAGPARAQSDRLVAKVDGVEIRESDIAMAEEDLGQNAQQMTPEAKRDYLVSYLTDVILAAKAAEGKKIADDKEFKSRIAFIRRKLLMEMLLIKEGKAAVTDAAMKKVYEDAVKQVGGEQEVRARHILVATEDEAKAIVIEINKGTDFAELARQKSKDPGAAAEGGDLGWFGKDQMVSEFADTAFKMAKGQVSEPVKTQFGWHVIKVEDKRTKPVPEFASVKDQVETFVVRKAQADYIAKLREGAKIERLDKK
jgi:peptidyl-prolyl cis-trans isomerase C